MSGNDLSASGVQGFTRRVEAVVMGSSAGAVEALSAILPELPAHYPLPVLIVVHLPSGKPSAICEIFAAKCGMRVKEAEDKEAIQPGVIYFAPPGYHLLVERERHLSLSADAPVLFCRPAIDVLFESAADAYGAGLVGVILTGANSDGAQGLKMICAHGGLGLVERPDLAQVRAMPQAALEACADAQAVTLEEIASMLLNLGKEDGVAG